jgi:hypothetical protein
MLPTKISFSGRDFGAAELELIRDTVSDFSNLSLTELSKTICELLEWKRPTGKLKYEECLAFLEHLRDQGVVILPGLRATAAPGPRHVVNTSQSDAQAPVTGSAGDFDPLVLHLVQASNPTLNSLFKQYVDRYHYLRYRIPFGAHLRYLVESGQLPGRYLACLQFSSPAWMMAPRDAWIGWSPSERKRNLQFIVIKVGILFFLGYPCADWQAKSCPWRRADCRRTGIHSTVTGRCFSKPSWTVPAIKGRPIRPATGSIWAPRKAEAAWTAIMRSRIRPSRTSLFTRCAVMRANNSEAR